MTNFDFFQNLLISLSNDIGNRMMFFARYCENDVIPVYFGSGGDSIYKLTEGGMLETKDVEVERVPRVVLAFEGVEFPNGARTLGTHDSRYQIAPNGYEAQKIGSAKSLGYEMEVGVNIIVPDFIASLQMIQYLQETFREHKYGIVFKSDGLSNQAVYTMDVSKVSFDYNHSLKDGYTDHHPSATLSITVQGTYENFGYYDLNKGNHGYNGYNKDNVTDILVDGGIDADAPIKKVTTNIREEGWRLLDTFDVE